MSASAKWLIRRLFPRFCVASHVITGGFAILKEHNENLNAISQKTICGNHAESNTIIIFVDTEKTKDSTPNWMNIIRLFHLIFTNFRGTLLVPFPDKTLEKQEAGLQISRLSILKPKTIS